jgi:hypothetical protein
MALTDVLIRSSKPREKRFKLSDGGGLYLEVSPTGGKWWRWKYRVAGKERRVAARQRLAAGIDPGAARRAEKLAQAGAESFEAIAREWHEKFSPAWDAGTAAKMLRRFERDVFPWLGKRSVNEVRAPELLTILRRIESRGSLETAHRVKQNCGQVFRYAVATGWAERDPTSDLRGALPPTRPKHHASIVEPKRTGERLRAIDG